MDASNYSHDASIDENYKQLYLWNRDQQQVTSVSERIIQNSPDDVVVDLMGSELQMSTHKNVARSMVESALNFWNNNEVGLSRQRPAMIQKIILPTQSCSIQKAYEFLYWSNKRNEAAKSHVIRTLLLEQADGLASVLRQITRKSAWNDLLDVSQVANGDKTELRDSQVSAFQHFVQLERKRIQKAKLRGKNSMKKAAKQLRKTSYELRDLRADTICERRFVEHSVPIERGFFLRPENMPTDCLNASLMLASSSDSLFFYSHECGKIYTTSASIGSIQRCVTELHSGEANCYVKSVCSISGVGTVALLCTPLAVEDEHKDSKDVTSWKLEVGVFNSTSSRVKIPTSKLEDLHDCSESYSLFSSADRCLDVFRNKNGLMVQFEVLESCDRSSSFVLKLKQQLSLTHTEEASTAFSWNPRCGYGLVLYKQCGVILGVGKSLTKHGHIVNRDSTYQFRWCAVSDRRICVVMSETIEVQYNIGVFRLFDFSGAPLKSFASHHHVTASPFDIIAYSDVNFVLLEQSDDRDMRIVFEPTFSKGLKYIRLYSSKFELVCNRCVIALPDASSVDKQPEVANGQLDADTKVVVDYSQLRTKQDSDEPWITAVQESEEGILFLDWRNNSVTRWSTCTDVANTIYKSTVDCNLENRVTGMHAIDGHSLLLVCGNCKLKLVDHSQLNGHCYQFARMQFRLVSDDAYVAADGKRAFVAVCSDETIFEIQWARDCADWCLTKAHGLPSQYCVHYLNFDVNSKRFALAFKSTRQKNSYGVAILDQSVGNAITLPLPHCQSLAACWLKDELCLVNCRLSTNLKRQHFVYDASRATLLRTADFEECRIIVSSTVLNSLSTQTQHDFVLFYAPCREVNDKKIYRTVLRYRSA